ncbi:hypothetical protein JCM21714_197 [Gracilibacillus boraciitolerans JCM 21714]|uniref:Uncharacterized protein n=1 Tax=Gracilibacillus boraciitolerans JCM 21714 TaxID=1298598 RepID=W4VDG1_9BACI|nr:hypothetical protein [Gracilibacillus boraciitolerans]GAE91252.1 hypothetical protein JCM21714_197 [Gracilibacillus boraciitolerans JCM 21714]
MKDSFQILLKKEQAAFDKVLKEYLQQLNMPAYLKEAVLYSINAGGEKTASAFNEVDVCRTWRK